MTKTGRFESTTKAKIRTPYGTVLKVSVYEEDCTGPNIEYRIRGVCEFCGEKQDCWCFTDDNFEDPLQAASEYLVGGFLCDKPECVIEYERNKNPENLKRLQAKYDDEYEIRDAIQESWGECDEGPEECGI